MKRTILGILCVVALGVTVAAHSARVADLTGKWSGKIVIDDPKMGGKQEQPTDIEVTQDGDKLTGKIGDAGKAEQMIPFTGKVDGDDVTITAKEAKDGSSIEVTLNLKLADGHLKGDGTFKISFGPEPPVTAKVSAAEFTKK